jgi:hypothetical protein
MDQALCDREGPRPSINGQQPLGDRVDGHPSPVWGA